MQNLNAASLIVAATALLAALPGAQAGLYSKNSPVIQVSAKTYDQLIAKSNHTAVSSPSLCSSRVPSLTLRLDCRVLCPLVRSL